MFTYNKNFHSSIRMELFEAIFRRRYMTPLCWYESGKSVVLELDIVQHMTEKIKLIQEKMRAS